MPPKRKQPPRGSAKKDTPRSPAPPSPEDAKPNIAQLNAEAELAADPLVNQPEEAQPSHEPQASTANATPVRRLDTLNQSPLGAAASTGKKSVSAPKFAGRRSQAKREELLKAEEERKHAEERKAAEEAAKIRREQGRRDGGREGAKRGDGGRDTGGSGVGNRGRGRGRGGYMGERETVASGPFSAGQVSKETQRLNRRWSSRGSGWKGLQVGTVPRTREPENLHHKTAIPSTGSGTQNPGAGQSTDSKPVLNGSEDFSMSEDATALDGGYISSDDEDAGTGLQPMDVEQLGIIDLTNEDADPFAPVRVPRVAHKTRSLGINADGATNQEGLITVDANDAIPMAASDRRKGKPRARDVVVTAENKGFQGVYSDSDSSPEPEPHVKSETDEDEGRPSTPEPAQVNADPLAHQPSSSPESRRRGKEKVKAGGTVDEPGTGHDTQNYQALEEIEEWERYQHDLQIIRSELGQPAPAAEKDGDTTMAESQTKDPRAEKVFLFQFPPVLPGLLPITVKPDPEAVNGAEDGTDMMEVDPPNNNVAKPITIQDDGKPEVQQPKLPSGAVGKLKVHASGRVTLDWGGTSLNLGMGTEASCLQEVFIATLPDQKNDSKSAVDAEGVGQAVSMGPVKGKFVVTPDWEELLG